jgi:protein-S-isoprenylcysteine O-methyltransferase Ste14
MPRVKRRLHDVALATYLVGMAAASALGWSEAGLVERLDLALYAVATAVLVVLTFLRPPPEALDARPWVLALAAFSAAYPLLYRPGTTTELVIVLHVLGDVALLSLGRSFAFLPARRRIQTRGLYALVRHPAYATYLAVDALFVGLAFDPWNAGVAALGGASLVARALLEERLLLEDPAYRAYAARVRARFVPFLFLL